MDNKNLIGFGITIICVIIGWFLNQLSHWLNTKADDKRNLKIALYGLLEVFFLLLKFDFSFIIDKAAKTLTKKIKEEFQEEISEEQLRGFFEEMTKNIILKELYKDLEIAKRVYGESIKAIKIFDPLMAYNLSDNLKSMNSVNVLLESLRNNFQLDAPNEKSLSELFDIFKATVLELNREELKKAILMLSSKINLKLKFRIIKKIKSRQFENIKGWEEYFEIIFDHLKDTAKKENKLLLSV